MKTTVDEFAFHEAFRAYGRTDNFSYAGRAALFAYLEELERDTGEEMELDVIALCCDWAEYKSAVAAAEEYGWTRALSMDDDEAEEAALDYLRENTQVIDMDGAGVIIQGF